MFIFITPVLLGAGVVLAIGIMAIAQTICLKIDTNKNKPLKDRLSL